MEYKSKGIKSSATSTVEKIRHRTRQTESNLRKQRREQLIKRKRFRHDSAPQDDTEEITKDQVTDASQEFVKNPETHLRNVNLLRRAFAQGTVFVDTFLGIDGSLDTLVGSLTSHDAELQLAAVWCFINISAGMHDHILTVVKAAAPYLITYLANSNPELQYQCAWCLGNLAAGGDDCRDLLMAQGCSPALIPLLKSTHMKVVRSVAFALSNLIKHSHEATEELFSNNVMEVLLAHLSNMTIDKNVLAEVGWVFTYLTTSSDMITRVVAAGALTPLVDQLILHANEDQHNAEVITPLLRCLGNILSGPDEYAIRASKGTGLMTALDQYMRSNHRFIQKESLWVLSNLAGTPEVCDLILTESMITTLINDVHSDYDIKHEALYTMCNLASHGEKYCETLVSHDVMPYIVAILKGSDIENINIALSLVEMLLSLTSTAKEQFELSKGLDGLEALEYHNNDELRQKTNDILYSHFYQEDEAVLA